MKIDYDAGIVRMGNTARIVAAFEKANRGEPITVAFLGGSITQGARSSTYKTCYAYRTYEWFVNTFPNAEVTYLNAGIGATTSHLGAARVREDVLLAHPDFVIVEFSVNDEDTSEHFKETYEGLVRQILYAENKPALMLVHNVRYDDGGNAEAIHRPIGEYYDLPAVTMKTTILPLVKEQGVDNRELTEDDLHPNDLGHELVAKVICHLLGKIKNEGTAQSVELPIKPALTPNRYEACVRKKSDALQVVANRGFVKDMTEAKGIWDCFKGGYIANEVGATLTIREQFTGLAVQYRKTVRKPAPIATLVIDGDTEHPVLLDSNFTEDWGDCLYLQTVTENLQPGEHEITITLTEATEDDKEVFYLVSLIFI